MYEVIDDYKDAETKEVRNEIFKAFCSSIWASPNKKRVTTRSITYNVRKDLLDTEIGKIFDKYSTVGYKACKTRTNIDEWSAYIRQRINNIYTIRYDKEVIGNKEYLELLRTPKKLYFRWIEGADYTSEYVTTEIDNAMEKALEVKTACQKRKFSISWNEYKKVVNECMLRIFNRCEKVENYDGRSKSCNFAICDFFNEDRLCIKYINKSIDGEIKNWEKRLFGLPQSSRKGYKRCKNCGKLIVKTGNKKMYCADCAAENERIRKRKDYEKRRIKMDKKLE